LHAIIYGTGKWAQLLKIKLTSLGLSPILIGNNPLVADYNRAETPHIAKAFRNAPVFIASATKDHFVDMVHSKMFDPSIIFVEKGFINAEEKASATSWAADRKKPVYILSQYRYSKVLEILESFKDDIISILHDWTIDKGTISEWGYHIVSIDNYIKLSSLINRSVYGNTGAKSAINSALLDLVTRIHSVPLYTLLGEKQRDQFKSMVILGNKTLEEDAEEATIMTNKGVDFFKIKIGKNSIIEEINHTYKIRQIIGKHSKLCVDANTGLSVDDLKLYVSEIKSANLLFLEQPFEDINQTASLKLDIPICMDESVFSKEDIITIKNKNAGQGVNLKNIKLSGPLYVAEAARVANELGMEINISAKVAETGIATSTLLHCAAVSPTVNWGISTTNQYLITDIIKAPKTDVLGAVEVDEYILKDFIFYV
jgi:L-alanine-DL-glutamate epimerase-like enolase superfamily enzyme